jgi:hypothetical protein
MRDEGGKTKLGSRRSRCLRCAASLLLLVSSLAYAGTGVSFLEIPVGARESALGGAGVALVSGPSSAAHNPAATAFAPRGVSLVHNRHFADTRTLFIGFNARRGRFAFTPNYWGTRVPDIEYRTEPTSEPISTFDAVNWSVGGTVAADMGRNIAVGAGARYILQKIHLEESGGWSMDAGVLARKVFRGLSVGAALQHLGSMSKFASESPKLPTTLRGGAAYEHDLGKAGVLMVVAEAQAVRDNTPQFKTGIEYRAPEYAALRIGWVEGLEAQNVSFGLGLFIKHFRLDYAFIPYRENLGEGHRFALNFDI